MSTNAKTIDLSALKFNQLCIITLTLLGFILNLRILPAIVAAVLIVGSAFPQIALFKLFYRYGIKPLNILKPELSEEPPAPHNFAQLLGGIVLAVASILLYTGAIAAGWVFAWIVILLAAVNLFFGFCAGCFVYFQLGKIGIPGFTSSKE